MRFLSPAILAALGLCLTACSSSDQDDGPVRGTKRFGQPCQTAEQCGSRLCAVVGDGLGVCTRACDERGDCPESPNWLCSETSEGFGAGVCSCAASGTTEVCGDGFDNDCDGKVDDCLICDGVPVSPDDARHCGKCGNQCRADQVCTDGSCACVAGKQECAGACVDLASDDEHCGACETACASGQDCLDGVCTCPDLARPDYCAGTGCTDSSSDRDNCGACGNECVAEQACIGGACVCPGSASPDYCAGVGCVDLHGDASNCGACGKKCESGQACENGVCICAFSGAPDFCSGAGCVNLASDVAHCGNCDTACTPGQSCKNGVCTCPAAQPDSCASAGCVDLDSNPLHCGTCEHSCSPTQQCVAGQCACPVFAATSCSGDCVDLQAEKDHCGACGHQCGAGQHCEAGVCRCDSVWLAVCGGACVNEHDDPKHCGTCGHACASGESCIMGQCSCSSGLSCGAVCVSESDPTNCGACGNSCAPGQVCASGTCKCEGAGLSACGNACVNLLFDEANCGSCGAACKDGESCSAGLCACPSGTAWCAETGTCTNLSASPLHCGSCGNACAAIQSCKQGVCTCPDPQQKYCPSVGKCVSTMTSVAHCGACDAACPASQSCVAGKCQCPQAGQAYCASADACVLTASDPQHCGGCDKACPPTAQCTNAACKCLVAGETICGSACVDVKNDDANCGACGKACASDQSCYAGQCGCPPPALAAASRVSQTMEKHTGFTVAWNGSHLGLAYSVRSPGGPFRFALLNPDGSRANAVDVELSAKGSGYPDVIWTGQEWGVAWYHSDLPKSLSLARLTPAGVLIGAPVDIVAATPGGAANAASISQPHIAFMPSVGYAFVTANIDFQVLGTDGTQPQPVIHLASPDKYLAAPPLIAASPPQWGLLVASYATTSLTRFGRLNADGTMTTAWLTLAANTDYKAGSIQLEHDGTTWVVATRREYCSVAPYKNETVILRGENLSSATIVGTVEYPDYAVCEDPPVAGGRFGVLGNKLAVMTATPGKTVWLRRYSLPADPNAPLSLSGEPLLVVDLGLNVPDGGFFWPVLTSANTLLATWLDQRWGNDHQIFARQATFPECK